MWQRLCWRLENLGFLFALAILDVLAIVSFTLPSAYALGYYCFALRALLETLNLLR